MTSLIYFSGFITCLSLMGFFIMLASYLKVKRILNKKDDEVNKYKTENEKIKEDTDKRMARYKSSGWYKSKDENDPDVFSDMILVISNLDFLLSSDTDTFLSS